MAIWTTPRTWVATAVATAAQFNVHLRDNLNAQFPLGDPAWNGWTPTITQSGAVSKTVTYGKYMQIGKTVFAICQLAVTGSGTSANNAITVSLPVTAATSASIPVGSGFISDSSATTAYNALVRLASTTTMSFYAGVAVTSSTVALGATGSVMTAGLASGDNVDAVITYEAA